MKGKTAGYALGAIAAATYGMNPTFALPLYADGMNPDSVLLLRYGLALPIIAAMTLLRGRSLKVPLRSIPALALIGLLIAFSSLTLFFSYNYMAAGIASTILFVYPVLVAVIMALFFKEKITLHTVLCLVLASAGILMLYNTAPGETLSLRGTLIVLASSFTYAFYLICVNQKSLAGIATLTVTFHMLIFGCMVFGGRILLGMADFVLPSRPGLWLNILALSVLPTIVSFACTTRAIQLVGSTPTAILGALEPLTAVILGIILFDEGMTAREAVGIVMILVAVTFVILRGSKLNTGIVKHLTRFRHMFPKLHRHS